MAFANLSQGLGFRVSGLGGSKGLGLGFRV